MNKLNRLYRRLFIPDTHSNNHDKKAWSCMLDVVSQFRPDEVVYLGDFWDCYSVSDFTKNPSYNFQLLEEELKAGRELLSQVERISRAKSYVFLAGNHEARIDRYIATYASKLAGNLVTREILGVPKHYKWFPYGMKNHYNMGKLIATHGTLCGQNPAAAMVKKYGCSVVFGHTHGCQEYTIRNAKGENFTAYNIGWLGDESAAEYIQNFPNWSHGFGIAHFKPNGEFYFQTITIKNYECVFNNTLISRRS